MFNSQRVTGPLKVALASWRKRLGQWGSPWRTGGASWLEQLPEALFELGADHRWSFLTREWTRISGWSLSYSLGTPISEFVHPQDWDRWQGLVKEIGQNSDTTGTVRLRLITRESHLRWVEIRARAHKPGFADRIIGTITDITDRVKGEDLRQAEHQNLVALVNRLPAMLYRGRNNRDWTMYFTSEGAYQLTGHSAQEIVNNRAITYGSLIHPEDRDKVWEEVQTALLEHRTFELLYRIITAQGYQKWVWERGQGVLSKGNELLGVEGFITEAPQHFKRFTYRAEQAQLYDDRHGYPTQSLLLDRMDHLIQITEGEADSGFVFLMVGLANVDDLAFHTDREQFEELRHQILERLRGCVGPRASLAVFNHHKVGILLPHRHTPREVGILIDRIRMQCQTDYRLGGKRWDLDLDIGIAMSQSLWASSEEVLESAEQAMVHAGAVGGTRESVTDQRLQRELVEFARVAQALPAALHRGEIQLEFQPVFHASGKEPAAWYGRLVWPQRRKAALTTPDFLPAVRNRDLIPLLQTLFVNELERHLSAWAYDFLKAPSRRILLRLDAPEFVQPEFLGRLGRLTGQGPGQTGHILPAIPSSLLETDHATERQAIGPDLSQQELGTVLDDFAGDFGLLSRLDQVEMIRLSPEWLREHSGQEAMVRAIRQGAEACGLQVVAPGITDPKQAQRLRSLQCDFLEGAPEAIQAQS